MKALDYIRKGWTQDVFARTADGRSTSSWDSKAVCWCARGAINAAYRDDFEGKDATYNKLRSIVGYSIPRWNDNPHTTQEEVIKTFEEAGI